MAKAVGIFLYLAVLLFIGAMASRKMKDMRDYFAGGKTMGFWAVAFSARATGESGWLLLGLTGMGALVGVQAFWVVLGEVLGVTGAWLLMARRFKRLTDEYDSITIPDYLESHFKDATHLLRVVAAVPLVLFVTIYVSAQIHATGTAFNSFLGWNYYVGALVGFGVVLVYIVTGGFVAVVWSDVFQGTLMFLGLVLLPIVGIIYVGGVGEMTAQLSTIDTRLLSLWGPDGAALSSFLVIVGFVAIGVGFMGSPQIFVRFLALKSEGEIPKGAAVAIIWTILADSGAVLTGMVGRAILTKRTDAVEVVLGKGAEEVLPQLVEFLLPTILVGLFIAVVLSAVMSTVDSLLVLAASAVVRDVYQKILNPELTDESLVQASRITTAVLAFVALGVALVVAAVTGKGSIFWFVIFGWSGIAATFCPTIILTLAWRGFTRFGAVSAMITGFVGVPFFKFLAVKIAVVGPWFDSLSELPPAFTLSLIVGLVVSLLTAREQA